MPRKWAFPKGLSAFLPPTTVCVKVRCSLQDLFELGTRSTWFAYTSIRMQCRQQLRFSSPIVVRQVSNATYESFVMLLQAFLELNVVHNNIQSGIGLVGSDEVCGFYGKSYTLLHTHTHTHTHTHMSFYLYIICTCKCGQRQRHA